MATTDVICTMTTRTAVHYRRTAISIRPPIGDHFSAAECITRRFMLSQPYPGAPTEHRVRRRHARTIVRIRRFRERGFGRKYRRSLVEFGLRMGYYEKSITANGASWLS